MKFLIFIFKRRFRQSALNNFLSVKKIKNVSILNCSGPILHYVGKFLYFFLRSKKIIFISCDGLDYLYRDTNSINLWMGGATHKIPDNFKKFKNNFVSASSLFTNESKLLTFFPANIHSSKINKDYKFVYISENKKVENKMSLEIWNENKNELLNDLSLIDNVEFWKKITNINDERGQSFYVDIKSLIRFELVSILIAKLKNKFILVGSNWKKYYPNALESNYSDKFLENLYRGNICIDFGSKHGEMCIYPRTCKIIESGGLLFQSINKDSKLVFKDLTDKICFISTNDMEDKISLFLKNSDQLDHLLIAQQKNFEKDDLNYKTLKKIEDFFNKS
tara:strand:- start:5322 stop:6326 length:1005 start_codon:yes stop_codon:yes gene_type:complete